MLSNGDRLSGTITKSDDKKLVIKTEYAGEVTVQWTAVSQIHSTQALHIARQNGQTVVGMVTPSDDTLVVTTAASETVNVPKTEITALRNDAEQSAYEKSLHPSASLLHAYPRNGPGSC